MKLKDIGERKLTYKITSRFSIPFDDCYFLPIDGEYLLLTTDMVRKTTHFPKDATPYHIGWYSIAVNISDVVAKGGEPFAYLVALGLPKEMDEKALDEILNGMENCIKLYGGKIIGGDTKEADEITIAITAIGKVKKKEVLSREGAKAGEAVFVTGNLGKGGIALLKNDLDKLLLIKPKIKEARWLAKNKIATACMDLSDGLASSLYQLSKINGIGFRIFADFLPIDEEANLEVALYYGGDYELLFTAPKEEKENIEKKINAKMIGEVIDEKKITLIKDGKEYKIENKGYEHFKST